MAALVFITYQGTQARANVGQDGINSALTAQQPAQGMPRLSLNVDHCNDFFAMMPTLATATKTTIVCESFPLHATLTPDDAKQLTTKLSSPNETATQAISDVAAAYDYEAVSSSEHLCLWRKKYTKGDDVPDVTIGEAIQCLKNIRSLYHDYLIPNSGRPTKTLIRHLSRADRKTLEKDFVPVSSFSPQLQEDMRFFTLSFTPGGFIASLNQSLRRLEGYRKPQSSIVRAKDENISYPALEFSFTMFGKNFEEQIAISSVFYSGSGGLQLNFPRDIAQGAENAALRLACANQDPVLTRSKDNIIVPKEAITIGQAMQDLRQHWNGDAPPAADPIIASKRLCLFGVENTPGRETAQGIADLYGLRFARMRDAKTTPPEWRITTPRVNPSVSDDALGSEALKLVPPPLLHSVAINTPNAVGMAYWPMDRQKQMMAIYVSAMARARGIADAALDASAGKSVLVRQLPPALLDDMAVANMAALMPELIPLTKPLPLFVTDFDHATIQMKISPDTHNPNGTLIEFGVRCKKDGKTTGIGGTSQIPNDQL